MVSRGSVKCIHYWAMRCECRTIFAISGELPSSRLFSHVALAARFNASLSLGFMGCAGSLPRHEMKLSVELT